MDIHLYSDPDEVIKNAKHIYGPHVIIDLSTRKDKKYMLFNPKIKKWVHFGAMGYEDFTKHKDENRRLKFRLRNRRFKDFDMYTPAYMSYYLLW